MIRFTAASGRSYSITLKIAETFDQQMYQAESEGSLYRMVLSKLDIPDVQTRIENLQSIHHPNLPEITDYGQSELGPFIVTLADDGQVLRYAKRVQPLEMSDLFDISKIMVSIVRTLNEQDYTHYSLSPDYIWRDPKGRVFLNLFQPGIFRAFGVKDSEDIMIPMNLVPDETERTVSQLRRFRYFPIVMLWCDELLTGFDSQRDSFSSDIIDNDTLAGEELRRFLHELGASPDVFDDVLNRNEQVIYPRSDEIWQRMDAALEPSIKRLVLSISQTGYRYLVTSTSSQLLERAAIRLKQVHRWGDDVCWVNCRFITPRRHSFVLELIQICLDRSDVDLESVMVPDFFAWFLNREFQLPLSYTHDYAYADMYAYPILDAVIQFLKHIRDPQRPLYMMIHHPSELDSASMDFIRRFRTLLEELNITLLFFADPADAHRIVADAGIPPNHVFDIPLPSFALSSTVNPDHLIEAIQLTGREPLMDADTVVVNHIRNQLDSFRNYGELLIFFALIRKPIRLSLIEQVFAFNRSILPVLNELVDSFILRRREVPELTFILRRSEVRDDILTMFEAELVKDIIFQFKSILALKDNLDHEFAVQFLVDVREYREAVELYIKQANHLRNELALGAAKRGYEAALRLIDEFSVDVSASVQTQVLQFLVDISLFEGHDSDAVAYQKLLIKRVANFPTELNQQLHRLVEILLDQGQTDAARKLSSEIPAVDITEQTRFIHGRLAAAEGDVETAEAAFTEIIESDAKLSSTYRRAHHALMQLYRNANRHESVVSLSDSIQQKKVKLFRETEITEFMTYKSRALYEIGEFEAAARSFLATVRQCEKNCQFRLLGDQYSFLGAIQLIIGDNSSAIPYFERAHRVYDQIQESEKSAYMLGSLSVIYKETGKISKAIEAEERVYRIFEQIEKYDELIYSLANLGHIYSLIYDYEQAEHYLQRALELSSSLNAYSSYCHANLYLSTVYAFQDRFVEAKRILMETINMIDISDTENYIHYIYYKSLLDVRMEQFDEAHRNLTMILDSQILEHNRKYHFVFTFLLGVVKLRLGETEAGMERVEAALSRSIQQQNLMYQLYINLHLYDFYRESADDRADFTRQNLRRIIKLVADEIHDDVQRLTFLQSRTISPIWRSEES